MPDLREHDLPTEGLRRAWAKAFRGPNEPVENHDDPRVVVLPHEILAQIGVDERDEGRFARVSVRRVRGPKLEHDEAVPIVAHVYLAGKFEPFPVDCVVGADGETLHYVLDIEAYKEAKAAEHIARAAELAGVTGDDAEVAAIQLACPLQALVRTWDVQKIQKGDERTIVFLSDHFLVPRRWIEFQIELYLGAEPPPAS